MNSPPPPHIDFEAIFYSFSKFVLQLSLTQAQSRGQASTAQSFPVIASGGFCLRRIFWGVGFILCMARSNLYNEKFQKCFILFFFSEQQKRLVNYSFFCLNSLLSFFIVCCNSHSAFPQFHLDSLIEPFPKGNCYT